MWRQLHAFEVGKDPTVLTVNTGGLRHGMTPERATCLAAVWASRTWLGVQRLPAAAVRVCSETVRERGRGPLRIVAQIVPELRAWLRDAFGLRGEALTSALTMSTLFEAAPTAPFLARDHVLRWMAMGVGPATVSRAEQWCAVARVGCRRGSRDLSPPLQLTMLWNLCVDMTSSGAPVLDRLMTIGRRSRRVVG